MCGIVGMVGSSAVNQRIYDALTVLQHRGQDAAGIMTAQDGELFMRKDSGLVRDVFQQKHMLKLKGNIGIGHVRYPTAGCDSAHDAQPFYVNSPYGICLGAQRQSDQRARAHRSAGARGPPASEHQFRFRSTSQCPGLRARAGWNAAGDAGGRICGGQRRVSSLPGRLRGHRHGDRPRHFGVSRSRTASDRW